MAEPHGAPPHGALLAIVVGAMVSLPFLIGEGAVTEAIADMLSPVGLLLLPVTLIIVIQFLSSDRGAAFTDILNFGSPDSFHRVGGSPIGVALVLVLILFLLYYKFSLFGGGDEDDE